MKRLLRAVPCLLLCLILLAATASADMGPKQSVTITVVNAPEGVYYLDLLHREDWDYSNVDLEDYDPALIEGLRHWEAEGWYPALVRGTNLPLFGDLTPGADGTHTFSYVGLPDTFRIAVSSAGGAQATAEPFTRTVFHTELVYDYESNTITRSTSTVGYYLTQFLSTFIPTLVVEGILLWLFGFRSRRSVVVFLIVNLVTQAALHILVGSAILSVGAHYLYYLMLLPVEVLILLVEAIVYRFLLRDQKPGRRVGYAICANLASYAAGFLPLHLIAQLLLGRW